MDVEGWTEVSLVERAAVAPVGQQSDNEVERARWDAWLRPGYNSAFEGRRGAWFANEAQATSVLERARAEGFDAEAFVDLTDELGWGVVLRQPGASQVMSEAERRAEAVRRFEAAVRASGHHVSCLCEVSDGRRAWTCMRPAAAEDYLSQFRQHDPLPDARVEQMDNGLWAVVPYGLPAEDEDISELF